MSEFLNKLNAFANAACELVEASELEGDRTINSDVSINSYPFAESFDEIAHSILNWRDEITLKLEKEAQDHAV